MVYTEGEGTVLQVGESQLEAIREIQKQKQSNQISGIKPTGSPRRKPKLSAITAAYVLCRYLDDGWMDAGCWMLDAWEIQKRLTRAESASIVNQLTSVICDLFLLLGKIQRSFQDPGPGRVRDCVIVCRDTPCALCEGARPFTSGSFTRPSPYLRDLLAQGLSCVGDTVMLWALATIALALQQESSNQQGSF